MNRLIKVLAFGATKVPLHRKLLAFLFPVLALALATPVHADQKSFADLVGNVTVQPVKPGPVTECPYMSWGGDLPLLVANGNAFQTQHGSPYDKLGLNLKFYHQDQFSEQVKDYLSGRTPYLRCTYSMLGPASEILNKDPRTKPRVFLFVSWSQGDHLVAKGEFKTLNDLIRPAKKVRVAVQQGGAHVGWLYELLQTVQASPADIEVVWCKEMTGPGSPVEAMQKDTTIDAAFAVSPDMVTLTSGGNVGTGSEGSVKGAHVLVSTVQMTHAIPDIVAVRNDYFVAHPDLVQKFAAGYLYSVEQVVTMRKDFEATHKLSPAYKAVLQCEQDAFGKDMIQSLENDGHGLLMDCVFGGLTGQISFFDDKGNLSNADAQMKLALDAAQTFGYIQTRQGFDNGGLDWKQIAVLANVKYVLPEMSKSRINAEAINIFPDSNLDDRTIAVETIFFDPAHDDFSVDKYGSTFQRALQKASQFPNAVIVIRGHSDPTKTLVDMIRFGMAKGAITRQGNTGSFQYYLNGQPLDLTATAKLSSVLQDTAYEGTARDANGALIDNPRQTMIAALNLSKARAETVKDAIIKLAKAQGVQLDPSQLQPQGVGILDPVIAKPRNMDEAMKNMRVEFRIVKINPEAIKPDEFNF